MTALLWVLSILVLAAITGFMVHFRERGRHQIRLQTLEIKAEQAQKRSNTLQEQLLKTQNDLVMVSKNLEREHSEKMTLVADYSRPFRRQNVMLGLVCLVWGLAFGGLLTLYRAEGKLSELRVRAGVAEGRERMFTEELQRIRHVLGELRQSIQQEMEARIIAETKLEMILDHVSGRKISIALESPKNKEGQAKTPTPQHSKVLLPYPAF